MPVMFMCSTATRRRSSQFPMASLWKVLRTAKLKLVQAWIEIHRDELMADWNLAVNGQQVFKIEPLK